MLVQTILVWRCPRCAWIDVIPHKGYGYGGGYGYGRGLLGFELSACQEMDVADCQDCRKELIEKL